LKAGATTPGSECLPAAGGGLGDAAAADLARKQRLAHGLDGGGRLALGADGADACIRIRLRLAEVGAARLEQQAGRQVDLGHARANRRSVSAWAHEPTSRCGHAHSSWTDR
jgi:hypothetical protein